MAKKWCDQHKGKHGIREMMTPRRMGKRNPRMRATDQSAKAQGAILLYGIGGWRMEGRRLFNTHTYHCTTQQHTMIEWRV